MFAVVVIALGWLVVFAGLLVAPPPARWRDRGPGYGDAQESPAVVSLLSGRLGRDGFAATLLDLSARGWFRLAPPRGAKGPVMCVFDGQVIRQWMIKGDEDSPDQYHLAIDDGARAKAWDLQVGSDLYRQATPGALVHARVNLWSPRTANVRLVQPAAVAPQLAEPGAPWDPRGPAGVIPAAPPDPRGYGGALPGTPWDPRGAGRPVADAPFDPRGHGPAGRPPTGTRQVTRGKHHRRSG